MSSDQSSQTRQKKERAYRKLQTSKLLRDTMTLYFLNSKPASDEGQLAWVTSGFPVEILVAMNVVPYYPEQMGALIGAERCGPLLCGVAEELGFSQELCSYARSTIGAAHQPEKAPIYGSPIPQALLSANNICHTVLKWFEAVSQMTGAPTFFLDIPSYEGNQPDHHLAYVRHGLKRLVDFLSQTFDREFSNDQLEEVTLLSNEAVLLWQKALEACKHHPSPLNCADRFVNMAPIVTLRGTLYAVNFYKAFLAEVEERVKQGVGAIIEERVRLGWDGIPPWFTIYNFFNSLAAKGVVFPADTYTHAWASVIERGDLFESIARTYSSVDILNKGLFTRIENIERFIKAYDLEGFVLFSNRSCKRYSLGQLITKEQVMEHTGVPVVIIEGDMVDSQMYNEAQVQTRMDAFLEIIL